jgi:hypothetical protein
MWYNDRLLEAMSVTPAVHKTQKIQVPTVATLAVRYAMETMVALTWRSMRSAGVWSQAVSLVLERLTGIWLQ